MRVKDLVELPELGLTVVAGSSGLDATVRWVHASDLSDPTPWLAGGEVLLAAGGGSANPVPIGIVGNQATQRRYIERLASHGVAALGLGLGYAFEAVPTAATEAADRLGFPIFTIPFSVPFISIAKEFVSDLGNEQLSKSAFILEVNHRLASAVIDGRGLDGLLAMLSQLLHCSLALVHPDGQILGEHHFGATLNFDGALELPISWGPTYLTLRAKRAGGDLTENDRLILQESQTALALELSRQSAVSATEQRLAGDLLDDIEHDRLDDLEIASRFKAFGLNPTLPHAAVICTSRKTGDRRLLWSAVERQLQIGGCKYVLTLRSDEALFLVDANDEAWLKQVLRKALERSPEGRIAIGRPGNGRQMAQSMQEARAALVAPGSGLVSYLDLGAIGLLLNLPDPALRAFADRVLGPAARRPDLVTSVRVLLEAGGHWDVAAKRLGIHRQTLRYRMARLDELCGHHPSNDSSRMDLWLAVKALEAVEARDGRPAKVSP